MHYTVQAYLYVCMKGYGFRINLYQPAFQTPEGNQYYLSAIAFMKVLCGKKKPKPKTKKTPHCPELRLSVKILEKPDLNLVIVSDS